MPLKESQSGGRSSADESAERIVENPLGDRPLRAVHPSFGNELLERQDPR
jgi:hypothetical protein